jgi:amidohydrolase
MDKIKKAIASITEEVIAMRRDFHAHPELGFEEHRTAQKVEQYLQGLGITTNRVAKTGVVGMLEGAAKSPVLLLRADLDALPIEEDSSAPYCSVNPGVMHACGHDAHIAMLLGAAKVLSEMPENLAGSLKLIFQPNEENAGALQMIEEGVLDNPQVDAAMGLHVWTPLESGKIGVCAGAVMGGLDIFKITVKGLGGHTGYPETAIDPLIAAADIIMSAQRIQTREISLMKPTVIMFGRISGGTKANIIPDNVTMEGSIRTLYAEKDKDSPVIRLKNLVERVCALHGCESEVEWYRENIPLVNDPAMAQLAAAAALEVTGSQQQIINLACMASEDFSEFSARVPGVFVFLGTGNELKGSHYPHHNPCFDIDEETLPLGVEMFVRFALRFFQKGGMF